MTGNSAEANIRFLAEERCQIGRMLGILAFATIGAAILGYGTLPVALGLLLALAGHWTVDRLFGRWLAFALGRERDAAAEQAVASILDRIPGSTVVHNVRTNVRGKITGDIDHILFRGDGGIFLVETKSHGSMPGEKRLQGFVSQTLSDIRWLRRYLKERHRSAPWIHAAVVLPNARVRVQRRIRGVDIIGADHLEQWIANSSPQQRLGDDAMIDLASIWQGLAG